jgi:hypothetical protein
MTYLIYMRAPLLFTVIVGTLALSGCAKPISSKSNGNSTRIRNLNEILSCKLPLTVDSFDFTINQTERLFIDRSDVKFFGTAKIDGINCEFWIDTIQRVQDIFIRDKQFKTTEGFKIGDSYNSIKDKLQKHEVKVRVGTYRAVQLYSNLWIGLSVEPKDIMDDKVVIEYFFKNSSF